LLFVLHYIYMSIKNNNIILASSSFIFLTIIFLTSPNTMPVYFFMVPFICIFLILLTATNLISKKLLSISTPTIFKKRKLIIFAFSFILTMLIALQSIGQLTGRDLITVAVLVLISIFYINRSSFAK